MIGLLLNIIFLPLNLLAMVILPPLKFIIRFFMRNIFLLVIIVAIALLFSRCEKSETPRQLTPAATTPQAQSGPAGTAKPILIEKVLKRENGDSAFATDLYTIMTDIERSAYSRIFFWTMNNVQNNVAQDWTGDNINGVITPTDNFQNKLGGTCRHFRETLKVHTIEQTLTGTACLQADGTWCKLKPNATPACGLGRKRGMLDGLKDLF